LIGTTPHEAGHTICAWVMGIRIVSIWITPWSRGGTGKVEFRGGSYAWARQWNYQRANAWTRFLTGGEREHILEHRHSQVMLRAITSAAGHAAQSLFWGVPDGTGCGDDFEQVEELAPPRRAHALWLAAAKNALDILLANRDEFDALVGLLTCRLEGAGRSGEKRIVVPIRDAVPILRPCTFTRTIRRLNLAHWTPTETSDVRDPRGDRRGLSARV
jgi:hypothetical protein